MYQSLSLSLSIYICKNGLGPDQTRMEFKNECFVNLKICACDRKYAKCSTKADAHDKMGFQYISISVYIVRSHARTQRRDTGGPDLPPPPEKSQKYRFSLQYWTMGVYIQVYIRDWTRSPVILKTTNNPAFNVGPAKCHLKVFRWRADDGPLLVIFGSSLSSKRTDMIRMEFRKKCFVNLNIWPCD